MKSKRICKIKIGCSCVSQIDKKTGYIYQDISVSQDTEIHIRTVSVSASEIKKNFGFGR